MCFFFLKNNLHFFVAKTIYVLFLSQTRFTRFVVAKKIYVFFCSENNLCIFLSQKRCARFFVAKTIYALRPESVCALKVAIRKVQTFWASAASIRDILKKKFYIMPYLFNFHVHSGNFIINGLLSGQALKTVFVFRAFFSPPYCSSPTFAFEFAPECGPSMSSVQEPLHILEAAS